jgi:hypothetical protein
VILPAEPTGVRLRRQNTPKAEAEVAG